MHTATLVWAHKRRAVSFFFSNETNLTAGLQACYPDLGQGALAVGLAAMLGPEVLLREPSRKPGKAPLAPCTVNRIVALTCTEPPG